jgi:hypothetical protein
MRKEGLTSSRRANTGLGYHFEVRLPNHSVTIHHGFVWEPVSGVHHQRTGVHGPLLFDPGDNIAGKLTFLLSA